MEEFGSKDVARIALKLSITPDRKEEKSLQQQCAEIGVKTAAADFGGEFIGSVNKIVERSVVSAKREGVIKESHSEEGAVAGACKEALNQIMPKALGLNVGGKIAVARYNEHIVVAIFFGVGLLHLNEIAVGLGHRVV
jgi:hypothetical protein